MLTEPWIMWCERVFASVSSHFHTFAEVYMCFICFMDKAGNMLFFEKTKTINILRPSLITFQPLIPSVDMNLKTWIYTFTKDK